MQITEDTFSEFSSRSRLNVQNKILFNVKGTMYRALDPQQLETLNTFIDVTIRTTAGLTTAMLLVRAFPNVLSKLIG